MTISLSQGAALAIASAYGSAFNITAITNAAEAVATVAPGHGLAVGDIVEITSGWDRLDQVVARVKTVATNDITLESVDTSSTALFPAGSGTGSLRKVTTFTAITQIASVQSDTPQVEFADITTLSNQTRKRLPTLDQAPTLNLEFFYDPALSWVNTVLSASDTNAQRAIRLALPNGGKVYANGYVKMSRFPRLGIGEAIKSSLTVSFSSIPVSYVS